MTLDEATTLTNSLAQALSLQHWLISTSTSKSVHEAEVRWEPHYRTATIHFNPKFLSTSPPNIIEHSIIHELVHLHLAPIDEALNTLIGESPARIIATNALETATDSLATAIQRLNNRMSG